MPRRQTTPKGSVQQGLVQPKPLRVNEKAALKTRLDDYYLRYCNVDFIGTDPIQFPHQFKNNPQQCELVALLAALFSFGRRETIIQTVNQLLDRMNGEPLDFVGRSPQHQKKQLKGFIYRFYQGEDIAYLCQQLNGIYEKHSSLSQLFQHAGQPDEKTDLKTRLSGFHQAIWGQPPKKLLQRNGLKFLLPNPASKGACKRLHMFLRWVIRQDDVDLGLWADVLSPAELLMPLDTHVAKQGRLLGLITRNSDDWQTVEELTGYLKEFCPEDPIKYDFSLFGLGIESAKAK